MRKTATAVFLTLVFTSLTIATPQISDTTITPDQVSHGDGVMISAEIQDTESTWIDVQKNGEDISTAPMTDRNNDNYYVSPVEVLQAEGGENYEITINACDSENQCQTQEHSLTPSCNLGLAGKCFH